MGRAGTVAGWMTGLLLTAFVAGAGTPPAAPPFPSTDPARWIGTPVTWSGLRGRVVLLDVWTFDCINCVHTLPWVRGVLTRYSDRGLTGVGIHTPEFDHERVRASVQAEVARHGLAYSQFLDNDYAYWRALDNQYWPTVYLVDRCGRIRARQVGEVHSGEESGSRLEAKIEALLAENAADCAAAQH